MKPAGLDYYLGTIEAGVMTGIEGLSYYIEAQDRGGAVRETPWYAVQVTDAKSAASGGAPIPTPEVRKSHIPVALIAGGAVAVGGAALLVANSGGGGGDDDGDSSGDETNSANNAMGTYDGNVTVCFTTTGGVVNCDTRAATIVVDANGKVLSQNIQPGSSLVSSLSGSDFTLTAEIPADAEGGEGEIFFSGTVSGNRIVGSVSGSRSGADGSTQGTYSGAFTTTKR